LIYHLIYYTLINAYSFHVLHYVHVCLYGGESLGKFVITKMVSCCLKASEKSQQKNPTAKN
jgi:hypothetical protein